MKPTYLAHDDAGDAIQALPCRPQGGWIIGVPAAGQKLVGPFQATTRIVTLRAVGTAILFQPGADDTVTVAVPTADVPGGGPHYLPAGGSLDLAMLTSGDGLCFVAIISANGTAGTVYVSERG